LAVRKTEEKNSKEWSRGGSGPEKSLKNAEESNDPRFIFLIAYGAFLFIVLGAFKFLNVSKISILLRYGINIKIMCAAGLLNLAGLPPFSGFFAKLFLIKTIINFTPLFLIFMLLNTSLLILLAYTFLSFFF
jgi:NADH:ubiquinone oxidoreductase subunit 2 (subunit N)